MESDQFCEFQSKTIAVTDITITVMIMMMTIRGGRDLIAMTNSSSRKLDMGKFFKKLIFF